MSRFARQFRPLYERWRSDIRAFAREGLGLEPTWQQDQLFDLVQLESWLPSHKRLKQIAVASGQGPGKTTASVVVALWRCLRYEDALCIVTSPSMRQCKQWVDECRRIMRRAHPMLRRFVTVFNTRVEINGNPIWGIKTATATRPENLQGIHEKRLTFIADEASGVPRPIIETIKGTLSNPDALFLMIGNPNTTDCDFYNCFTTQRQHWHTLAWNAEETARDYPQIVSPDRNARLEREYGRDSNVYRVRVLGQFPSQDPNSVMALSDLEICTRTSLLGCASITNILPAAKSFGIDYSRHGGDESVIGRRHGLALVELQTYVKKEPVEVTDAAFLMQHDAGWRDRDCWYCFDAGGMGQGVAASYSETGKQAFEFHTQGVAYDSAMYADVMTEAWFCLRNLVKQHVVHLPDDPRLLQQLSTRQYYFKRDGRLIVESKDEWRERLETDESPDRADAVVMAFYPHVVLEAKVAAARRPRYIVGSKGRARRNR